MTKIKCTKKDSEWSGLLKVPDHVIIEKLRIELGQANSYIEELKADIIRLKNESEILKTIENLEKQIVNIKASNSQLRRNAIGYKNLIKKLNNKIHE